MNHHSPFTDDLSRENHNHPSPEAWEKLSVWRIKPSHLHYIGALMTGALLLHCLALSLLKPSVILAFYVQT